MSSEPLIAGLARELGRQLTDDKNWQCDIHLEPTDWIEKHFYVPNVIHPVTGEHLGEGPIILADYQGRVLREALSRLPNGDFRYSTILWSDLKKSAKTTLAAAVALWFAATQTKMGHIYCLANDGKGSQDREYTTICIAISKKHSPLFENVKPTLTKLKLPNNTVIEAIPCDPEGEAGSEPDLTVWGEVWGFRQTHKLRLWTEMTVPPTKFGRAMRWVESYAGYEGESTLLENLYKIGVGPPLFEDGAGKPHPGITDLPLWVNQQARMLTFWKQYPMLSWQTPEYYAAEAQQLTDPEFRRVHKNEWVSPVNQFVPPEVWDSRKQGLPPLDKKTPVVVGLDAAISHDCCALVVTSRWGEKGVAERFCKAWYPPENGRINLSETMEPLIRWCAESYNVIEFSYDDYQLEKLAQDLQAELGVLFKPFGQQKPRAIADKALYDMIMSGEFVHTGDEEMAYHIRNAAAKAEGEKMLRIVKRVAGKPIDLVVAASMAAARIRFYNV